MHCIKFIYFFKISIRAPTRGATRGTAQKEPLRSISIRAPTRGATRSGDLWTRKHGYFNPRSHEGSDGRRSGSGNVQGNFNPRSHEGSDVDPEQLADYDIEISIRAPTRGATWLKNGCNGFDIFQSALPRGERRYRQSPQIQWTEFQSALPRGERRLSFGEKMRIIIFQSALPRGERLLI